MREPTCRCQIGACSRNAWRTQPRMRRWRLLNMDDKSTAALSDRRWLGRIERAIELQSRYPEAAPMLQFYARVLAYQRQVAHTATTPFNSSRTFREQIDISRAVRSLPDL